MANTIVIFGASGDLTSRKLIPALYKNFVQDRLETPTHIVGVSRSAFASEQWRAELAKTTQKFAGSSFSNESWDAFSQHIHYVAGDVSELADLENLNRELQKIEGGQAASRVYYLSIMPQLYAVAVHQLGAAGLADDRAAPRRVVIEKPFGTDLETARQLNQQIHEVFREDQVYRIDHYLGKETVQNILVLRFGNTIFEPIWNRNYIDHVQITAAEEVKVGRRGGYYDRSGILRDMFQNHIFQLMMIIGMEAPARFDSTLVRDEKVKVLQSIRTVTEDEYARIGIRGQYDGYLAEEGVPSDSQTETFAALKLHIDNWRWKGVPFYLRSGKAMSCRSTQIVIQFREPPHLLFGESSKRVTPEANRLVIQIQPAEGIQLHFQSKVPDQEMKMRLSELDFRFNRDEAIRSDAYQRLLLDALQGDASLFARSDEVEQAWRIIDPILAAWRSPNAPELLRYEEGFWGPKECVDWMHSQNRSWFDQCPILT